MLPTHRIALLDLDGTLYRGQTVIPGAQNFVERLRQHHVQPVFFTNNSTRTPEQVAAHLRSLGFDCAIEEVCTSAQAAAALVEQDVRPGAGVVYIGMDGVRAALIERGLVPIAMKDVDSQPLEPPTAAVLGLQTDLTYAELATFCRYVTRTKRYVLTNGDLRLPVQDGFLPGNGAFGRLVTAATGVSPIIAGKPEVSFIDYALRRFGAALSEAVIIGDNLSTDIAAGNAAGIFSIQVLTGVQDERTDAEGCDAKGWKADACYPSVDEILR